MRKILTAIFIASISSAAWAFQADLMPPEAGDYSQFDQEMKSPESTNRAYAESLKKFFQADLKGARQALQPIAHRQEYEWLREYLDQVIRIQSEMVVSESEHFILRTSQENKFLADY